MGMSLGLVLSVTCLEHGEARGRAHIAFLAEVSWLGDPFVALLVVFAEEVEARPGGDAAHFDELTGFAITTRRVIEVLGGLRICVLTGSLPKDDHLKSQSTYLTCRPCLPCTCLSLDDMCDARRDVIQTKSMYVCLKGKQRTFLL